MVTEYRIIKLEESHMEITYQKVVVFQLNEMANGYSIASSDVIFFVADAENLMTQAMLDCARENSSFELELELSDVVKRIEMIKGRGQLVHYHQSAHIYIDPKIRPSIFNQ